MNSFCLRGSRFRIAKLGFCLLIFLLPCGSASGDLLLGNLPFANDNGGTINIGTFGGTFFTQAAYRFTLPAGSDYTLDTVVLRLKNASSEGPPLITINHDGPGGTVPGAAMGTLTNPPLADTTAEYTFTPPSTIILAAATAHWLVVDHATNGGLFQWTRQTGEPQPTGLVSSFSFHGSNGDDGATYLNNLLERPGFEINGTVVPEPTTCGLALAALCLAIGRRSG